MLGPVIQALLFSTAVAAPGARSPIVRHDAFVAGEPGIRLFVREVLSEKRGDAPAVLLIHGARVPGLASFDLDAARTWRIPRGPADSAKPPAAPGA